MAKGDMIISTEGDIIFHQGRYDYFAISYSLAIPLRYYVGMPSSADLPFDVYQLDPGNGVCSFVRRKQVIETLQLQQGGQTNVGQFCGHFLLPKTP